MIHDYCPNCGDSIHFFNFSCGSEIEKQFYCLKCRFCSYTFLDHDRILDKIIHLSATNRKFYVTCNNDFIFNWSPEVKNENTILLKQAPTLEEIQKEASKVYDLKLDNIIGYDDIKDMIRQVINVKGNKKVHLAILGYQGTAKTVFLESTKQELEAQGALCDYVDCANLTGSGLMDYVLTQYVDKKLRFDFMFLDEIDKTDYDDQKKFLNMLQSGLARIMQKHDKREAKVSFTAIATGNNAKKIYPPLLDRFISVGVKKYSKEQFFHIGESVLKAKFNFTKDICKQITLKLWQSDHQSLRRIDDLGKLLKDEQTDQLKLQALERIIKTIKSNPLDFNQI